MVVSMVNIQHQIVTHKLQTKHSKGVTVNRFLPLERSVTRFAISSFLLCEMGRVQRAAQARR